MSAYLKSFITYEVSQYGLNATINIRKIAPEFRVKGLLKKMGDLAKEEATERGMRLSRTTYLVNH